MTNRSRRSIEADGNRIQRCEQRLALSASLTADLLLDAFDAIESVASESRPSEQPDLLTQAAQLRSDAGLDGSGQIVAVIDSGIAWDHDVFGDAKLDHRNDAGFGPGYRIVGGWDFAENDSDPYDDGPAGFHGTHVAGLLAGQSEDFVGIAPGAELVALRVFDDTGDGQLEWIESALKWVHDHRDAFDSPITTVNLSIGAMLGDENLADARSILEDEFQQLRDDNILVFAAAGNQFDARSVDEIAYPASSPLVQAVTSIDSHGDLSDFSQRHAGVLATHGESVSSSVPEHVFGFDGTRDDLAGLDGTSMATPQVAAASMLVRQSMIDEGLDPTNDEIMDRLRETAQRHVDSATGDSFSVIDLSAALKRTIDSATRFQGDNESQQVTLDLTDGIRITVNGQPHALDSAAGVPLMIDVAGGADSLRIIGSNQSERVVFDPNDPANNRLTTNTYEIELRGFEEIVFAGGGGRDRATIYDSLGDDTLQSRPSFASLSGVGFRFEVNDVPRIYAHAGAGGSDTAFLRDSDGDDILNVRPQFTSLRGNDTFQLANGFERVYAYATSGGTDSAELYDSDGDDVMSISPARSIITGPSYQVSARGFDVVNAYATAGGDDIARIYADVGENQWSSTGEMVRWTDRDLGKEHVTRGFERAQVFENFQPIDLVPQSRDLSMEDGWRDDKTDRDAQAANAIRAVFDLLGE